MNFNHNTVAADSLQARLLSRAGDICMLPEVACEALTISKNPECRTEHLACIVERDMKLATDVIQMANSPIFGGSEPILDLKHAIVRLGLIQCRNLILTTSAASMIKKLPLEQEWIREVIWQHSFVTATTCVYLNRYLKLGFQGEEFTSGLLHDFGRLLFAVADPDLYSQVDDLSFDESEGLLDKEREIMGMDHCEFGAWYAAQQELPEELIDVIANHHKLPEAGKEAKLVVLVGAADHIANHIQKHEEEVSYDPLSNHWLDSLDDQFGGCRKESFVQVAPELLENVMADTNTSINSCGSIGGGAV